MSYELYPNLLDPDEGTPELGTLARMIGRSKNLTAAAKKMPTRGLRTFVSRCARGALRPDTLADLLRQHELAGQGFATVEDQLAFIERCCRSKMQAAEKSRWGLKCSNRFADYARVWPDASFLNVVRDGRDVLASQLRTGSFDNSPAAVGQGWSNTHERFRELSGRSGIRAVEVRYERLVTQPEAEVPSICNFLGIAFDSAMLDFHRRDLSIYRSHHLSMDRISKPIDASKLGRWRDELSDEQLKEFMTTAEPMMRELGYLDGAGC